MALSGDGTTALVGAHQDDDPNGEQAGSAYVFELPANDGDGGGGGGGVIAQYDEDGSGTIDNRELLAALADSPDQVSNTELLELLSAYKP